MTAAEEDRRPTRDPLTPMLIGYARISTADQTLDLQKDALKQAGCERIFTDIVSGAKAERLGFDDALNCIRAGDTLVVWRLDRQSGLSAPKGRQPALPAKDSHAPSH